MMTTNFSKHAFGVTGLRLEYNDNLQKCLSKFNLAKKDPQLES